MPILVEHRPLFKIAQILMILKISSRSSKTSLIRLHFFNWILKDDSRKKSLLRTKKVFSKVWGIDPTLNSAIEIAIAESLIERESTNFKITSKGKKYLDKIISSKLLIEDYDFLKEIGKSITEGMINEAVRSWK